MRRTTSKVIINFLALVIASYFLFTSASEIFAQEFIGYSAAGIDANSIKPVVAQCHGVSQQRQRPRTPYKRTARN